MSERVGESMVAREGDFTAWRRRDSRRVNWNLLPLYSSARSVSCRSGLLSLSRRRAIQGYAEPRTL